MKKLQKHEFVIKARQNKIECPWCDKKFSCWGIVDHGSQHAWRDHNIDYKESQPIFEELEKKWREKFNFPKTYGHPPKYLQQYRMRMKKESNQS